MKLRTILHILISYTFLFPAGIVYPDDTPSTPVSVLVPASAPVLNGDVNASPLSVGYSDAGGVPRVNGEVNAPSVSVGFASGSGVPPVNGEINARAVSVMAPAGPSPASGQVDGIPVNVAFKPANTLDPDIVGLWHMDGNWRDYSGNDNHGLPVGSPGFSTDKKIGTHSGSFNGSSYAQIADSASLDLASTMTLEAWIKPGDIGNYRQIVSKFGSSGNYSYQLGLAPSGGLRVDISGDGSSYDALVTPASSITANTWLHVAATFDAGALKLYVNGALAAQKTSTITALKTGTTPLNIGRDPVGVQYFNGLIDEIIIYKRALTAEEIALHANAGVVDPAAPAAPVLDDAPSVVGASTITLSGTKTPGTSVWVNNKKIAPFDDASTWQGAYGTLQPGLNILNVTAMDMQYRQSTPVTRSVIYDDQPPVIESSSPANNTDTARPVTSVTINLTDTYSPINLSGSIEGATVKNSTGQAVTGFWSVSGTKTIIFTPSGVLPADTYMVTVYPTDAVGNRGQQQIVFTNHDLSAPVTRLSISEIRNRDGWYYSTVTMNMVADDGPQGAGIEKIEYSLDGITWQPYAGPFVMDKDGVNTLTYRSVDKAGNIEAAKSAEIKINKTGLVGLWHMDDDNWVDSSVAGNHGTPYNGAAFSANAKIGTHAGSFDGVDDYTSTGLRVRSGARSVFFWVKYNSLSHPSGYQLCGTQEIGAYTYTGIANGGQGYSYVGNSGGLYNYYFGIDRWYFVGFTVDGAGTVKHYVDGLLVDTKTYTSDADATVNFLIGRVAAGHYINGLIDEVAVYNRTLSDTEIQEHYRSYSIQPPTVDPVQSPTTVAQITLSGTKPADTAIVVNGATLVPLDDSTTWSGAYTLQPGMNSLSVTAMDAEGFHSQAVVVPVAVDLNAPTVTSTDPINNGLFNTAVATVTFNLADAFSDTDLTATTTGASVRNSSGSDVSGTWSATFSGMTGSVVFTPDFSLSEGTYTAAINPTDVLGNHATHTITFTMDATPPQPPTIDSVPPTRYTTKTITGTKSADSASVAVTCDGSNVGVVTYPTALTWSTTISNLREGSNTVTAYARDAAGNQSGPAVMTFVVDTVPPAPPVVNQSATPTRDGSVTLSGTKEAGTNLYVNSSLTGNDYFGTVWSHILTLSEGANTFTVFAKDAAENQSQPVSVTVVRDTTAPRILSSTPPNNGFANQAGTIDVVLYDDKSAVDLNASLSGASVKNIASGTVIDGSWSVQNSHLIFTKNPAVPMPDGGYTVTLQPVDVLGNSGTASFSFTLDPAPPVVQSVTMNAASPHRAETVTFTVTFSEDMLTSVQPTVTFNRWLLTPTYALTGNWTGARTWVGSYAFTANNGDGSYDLKVAGAKDKAQNVMQDYLARDLFVLDTEPPASPSVNAVTTPTKIANQALTGAKEAATAIIINNVQRVALDQSTAWSYTYQLSEGQNALTIKARDAAGNESATIAPAPVIVLDTTPPAFTINACQNPSSTPTQILTGTKEAGCIVKLDGVQIIGSEDQGSTWSWTVTLNDGFTNHFVFTASDSLGNTTTKTADILYDIAPPAALGPGVLVADGSGKGTEVTLSWPAYVESPDIAYYRVYRSSTNFTDITGLTPIGTTNKGIKTYKATGLTQGSTYYFAVVPVDTSGNFTSSAHTAVGVPVDTVAPEDVTILSVTAGYTAAEGNTLTVRWNPSVNSMGDLADQVIYIDAGAGYDAGTSMGTSVTSYTKTGLADATLYKVRIKVKDTLGHESAGVLSEGVTRLANPTALTTNPGNGKVSLTWTKVSSPYVQSYKIYRVAGAALTDVAGLTPVAAVNASTSSYTDTGLTNGTTYQYAVTTLNISGAERTDVQSIAASPRGDTTGPVISGFNVTAGQVITAPFTITASASDAESSMGRMELFIDSELVKTQNGGSISYSWDVVTAVDGNHTIKLAAYDQLGNVTDEPRQVIASLAPPATPVITGYTVLQTAPRYLVNVTGTAAPNTTVTLKVNGLVVATSSLAPQTSNFAFASVELVEGDNLIAVKASHRGGDSPYCADYKIVVDTGAPQAPTGLSAQTLSGGVLRFTWQNGAGELPTGYNLYMAPSSFSSKTEPGVTKVNTAAITYTLKEYTPPDSVLRYYVVTALDSSGNESGLSNVISLTADGVPPTVTTIAYAYAPSPPVGEVGGEGVTVVGLGTVTVMVTVSEPLKEIPFFSLEPQDGSPIVLTMAKVDDTHYTGSFTITGQSPHGPTAYKFSGKDMVGNRGNAQGTGITIDVKGPEAAVQSPLTTLQITAEPIQVSLVLNEPSVITPLLELKASDGSVSQVTGLASADNGVHWTGTVNISAMPEGRAEFVLREAKDRLGNTGTAITAGRYILLYRDQVPAPGAPEGLAAKTEKAGAITLTWYPVVYDLSVVSSRQSAVTYNLYRRAEGETAPVRIQAGIGSSTQNSTTALDVPPSDGVYYYSVTSVGLLGSESAASAEVRGVSDRTGPSAPANLALALTSGGITATWDAVTDTQSGLPLKGYHLYRSSGPITSSAGLTPVARPANTMAVDASPSRTYRFYAVASVDSLGNEGPLSETREIVFPVSPVRDLVLERIEDAAPRVTWQAPQDGTIVGYHIYRNSSRITPYPVSDLAYTDGYYASGTAATYGVSAMDNLGNESPIKEVTLPPLSLDLKQGTVFRRGLLETVPIVVSTGEVSAGFSLRIDAIDVKVGAAPTSSIHGPFDLASNSALQLEKVAATTADALSPVAVYIQANWSPLPGVTVKVGKTSSAEVIGSSASLEIYNDPLVRNTDAQVRLKVNNIGSSQMEFVTSENSTRTTKVKVLLKDQDGNLLSTGYLDQRVGASIVNAAGYAVARLNPNESILTEPITVPVPVSAPYKVIIEAMIDNTYYHYAKPDQVTAPGIKGTAETYIQETAYRATAAPEKTFYATAQPVVISGSAISNDPAANGQLVPNVSVKLGISVRGFDRFYTVTTDATGNFSYTFTPGGNEAGTYSVWAAHPDVRDRTVQSTFMIAGMSMSPATAFVRMARNRSQDIPVTLNNYGGGNLTGLTFTTTAGPGVTADVINPGDTTLAAGEQQGVTLRLTTSSDAPDTTYASLKANVAEGIQRTLDASISVVSLLPIISTSPSYIDTGMVRGDQKIASFAITNTGQETLKNARIEGPSTSWMSLTINRTIGDIAPGASASVGVMFNPPSSLNQGVYDDKVVIYSDNHIPYTYHIQVTVTSSAVGNVLFDVLNILSEDVPDATITFQHQLLTELIYSVKTGADGTAMKYDIPEGRYTYTVTPPTGHMPAGGTFIINAGMTTPVYIALEVRLVDVTWSVTPTTIEDQYQIQITQTFATNVPVPVLVAEPSSVTIPELQPGQVFNGEYTIRNHGLISAENVRMDYPRSFGSYDIEVFTSSMPNTIPAQGSITVPYRVARRVTSAWLENAGTYAYYLNATTLFEEVRGFGAGCVTSTNIVASGDYTQCPNTPQQTTGTASSTFPLGFQQPCPGSASGGSYIPGSGSGSGGSYTGGSSTGSQTTTSGLPPQGTNITVDPGNPCECKPNCSQVSGCNGVCVNEQCTAIPENAPGDCKQPTCDPGQGIILVPNDGEMPPQGPSDDCRKEICQGGSPVSVPNDTEVPHQGAADDCKREVCQNGSSTSINNDSEVPPQGPLDDCKREVCLNGSSTPVPNDSEIPPQGPINDCKREICQDGSSVPVPDDSEVPTNLCKKCVSGEQINKPDCTRACGTSNMCCIDGNCTQNNPIQDLDKCPNRVQSPGWQTVYDGCTLVPDNPVGAGFFTSFVNTQHTGACDVHDQCYQTCWSSDLDAARAACDQKLLDVAIQTCLSFATVDPDSAQQCVVWSEIYYAGLRIGAGSTFRNRQKEVCNCCP